MEHKPSRHAELLVVQHTASFSPRSLRVQPCPREKALRTASTRYFYRLDAPFLSHNVKAQNESDTHTNKHDLSHNFCGRGKLQQSVTVAETTSSLQFSVYFNNHLCYHHDKQTAFRFLFFSGNAAFRRMLKDDTSSALCFVFCFERFFCPPKPNLSFLNCLFLFGLHHNMFTLNYVQ